MPNSALTDAGVRRLPLPADGTTATHWDTTQKGLGVRVSPKGTKTFIALVGSGARHKIGRYPHISLALAREEARKLLAKKELGQYEKPHVITYETAIERYLSACADKNRMRTIADYKKHLERLPFKGRRLTTIRKSQVAAELEKITAKSVRAHVLTSIKAFFNWCAAEGYIDASPISALKPPVKKAKATKRSLSPAELIEVLSKALRHPYPFGAIVALLILNGQRRNETVRHEWERITRETITVPADIAKNGVGHTFPYGSLTRQVLDSVPAFAKQSQYVFPSRIETGTVFNGWSKAKKAFDATLEGVKSYTLHDLRRTFTTTLQSLGVAFEVRERLVNHLIPGVAGTYSVYAYENEMAEAIAKYDAFLVEQMRSGKT